MDKFQLLYLNPIKLFYNHKFLNMLMLYYYILNDFQDLILSFLNNIKSLLWNRLIIRLHFLWFFLLLIFLLYLFITLSFLPCFKTIGLYHWYNFIFLISLHNFYFFINHNFYLLIFFRLIFSNPWNNFRLLLSILYLFLKPLYHLFC